MYVEVHRNVFSGKEDLIFKLAGTFREAAVQSVGVCEPLSLLCLHSRTKVGVGGELNVLESFNNFRDCGCFCTFWSGSQIWLFTEGHTLDSLQDEPYFSLTSTVRK